MLKILKGQEEFASGIVVAEETKNASSLPFVLHYLATLAESSQKVALVTSKLSEMNYRLMSSKAGIRWSPDKIAFIELIQPSCSFETSGEEVMNNLLDKLSDEKITSIIFDDFAIFEELGFSSTEINHNVYKLYDLLKSRSSSPTLFVPFSVSSNTVQQLKHKCHVYIELVPVGHGFGKDASSKAIATVKKGNTEVLKKGILLSGERTNNGVWVTVN